MSHANSFKRFLVGLLISTTSQASYSVTARNLTWEEAGTLKQCKVKTCMADDHGDQYVKVCSQHVNEDGTTSLIMVVLFSKIYGDDCYCPCVGYFIDAVKSGGSNE